jgi:site-specific recombinase XerD
VGLGVLTIGHSLAPLHEFVVQAHGADKALSDVQQLAGHSSLATTQRYSDSDAKRKLVSLL